MFTRDHPAISNLIWVGTTRARIASIRERLSARDGDRGIDTPALAAVEHSGGAPEKPSSEAASCDEPCYRNRFSDSFGNPVFQMQVPLIERGAFQGALIADIRSIRSSAITSRPRSLRRHAISVLDEEDARSPAR